MVKDPNFQSRMDQIMGDVRPEAVYFVIEDGQRTVYFIVNAEGVADMPRIAEPLWHSWNADVTVLPAFTPDDMAEAMPVLEHIARTY